MAQDVRVAAKGAWSAGTSSAMKSASWRDVCRRLDTHSTSGRRGIVGASDAGSKKPATRPNMH